MPTQYIRSTRARALSADQIRVTFNFVGSGDHPWSWEATLTVAECESFMGQMRDALGVAAAIDLGSKTHV